MPSSITLGELRERVARLLQDATNATWSEEDLDGAIRQALAKFNQLRPRAVTEVIDAETREIDISALPVADANSILQVWFPYDATEPNALPTWVDFETFSYNDTLYLRLLNGAEPGSGDVARVVYHALHTLEDLDGATSTTFYTIMEAPIAKGAAAFAFLQRAGGLSEDPTKATTSTPNQGKLYEVWMNEFLQVVAPRTVGVSAHPAWLTHEAP